MNRTILTVIMVLAAVSAGAQDASPAKLWQDLDKILPRKGAVTPVNVPSGSIDWSAKVAQTEEFMVTAGGTPVEPFAMFYLGNFYFDAGRLDEAKAIFETIVTQFPDHPLVKLALADNKSLVRQAIEDCAAELSWQTRYPRQEIRKPVLDEKVTATMHLSTGDVKLRFYANVAPAHVANFLKRAEAGEYDGTKVGMVMLDSTVTFGEKVVPQAGRDPREGGTDPTQTQPHEYSMLSHARGTLSMSRGGAGSSLQLFQVVIKDQSNFDFTQTIFGRVVEGIEVVDAIARGPKDQFQRPSPEVLIKNVTIRREP